MDVKQLLNFNQQSIYELIIRSTDNAIISKDLDGCIISWNKAAEKIFGYLEEDILNCNISIIIPQDLREEEEILLTKIKNNQIVDNFETKRVKKDGTIIDVLITLSPIKDLSGNVIGSSKILVDISEKIKTKKALEESEKKYRTLFRSNPLPMFLLELPSLKFIEVNDTALDHYGYSSKEFSNMTDYDIRPIEDHERLKFVVNPKAHQTLNVGVWRHIKKDGSIINVEVSTHNLIYNGKLARMVLCNDITDKLTAEKGINDLNKIIAESETRFRTIIEQNRDIITLVNEKQQVTYRSPSAVAISGYTQEEIEEKIKQGEIINQLHPDDHLKMKATVQKVYENSGIPINANFRYRHKDGHYIWLEGTITNFLGNPILKSIINNFLNVTDRKEIELELEKEHEKLRKLTKKIPIAIFQLQTNYNGNIFFSFVSNGIKNIFKDLEYGDLLENATLISDRVIEEDQTVFQEMISIGIKNLLDFNFEFRVHSSKDSISWVKIYNHPEIEENGNVVWYGYLEDVTLEKQSFINLEKQNNQLKDIAWTQSHLVRAPLSRLMGLVNALERDIVPKEDQKLYLQYIKSSAIELDAVIKEISKKANE